MGKSASSHQYPFPMKATMAADLSGEWTVTIGDGTVYPVTIPGTLDESGIGHADVPSEPFDQGGNKIVDLRPWATRLTRNRTFEGPACYSRDLPAIPAHDGDRLFLVIERSRMVRLLMDGEEVRHHLPWSLITPHVFEITDKITEGSRLTVICDNSYPGMERKGILHSSTATDETQTNWNGLLGNVSIVRMPDVFISGIRVFPHLHGHSADIEVDIDAARDFSGRLDLSSAAFARRSVSIDVAAPRRVQDLETGEDCPVTTVHADDIQLSSSVRAWDIGHGNLYTLSACLHGNDGVSADDVSTADVRFGIRDFGGDAQGRLTINGRRFFLRSEANCAEFPETGYPPMDRDSWARILERYRSYGVNCVRFHSHTPPQAAFEVADEMGMLIQSELSYWNPDEAFVDTASYVYARQEICATLRYLADHPSFVMLTLGNELGGPEPGRTRMSRILEAGRKVDPTRLLAISSNPFYGGRGPDPSSDFYSSQAVYDQMLRATSANRAGYLDNEYPSANHSFDRAMATIRRHGYTKPVFGFEVGQYEILPDFSELPLFRGITDPANYRIIRDRVEHAGLMDSWPRYVEATGEIALQCYREETEAVLRTKGMSGLSILGLQDFPGQGTALVGMLNAHLEPKPFPFARPERFRKFFADRLPLVLLDKYTYTAGETLSADVEIANYGDSDLAGQASYSLDPAVSGQSGIRPFTGSFDRQVAPCGQPTPVGTLSFQLPRVTRATEFTLTIRFGDCSNSYPIWVYPDTDYRSQDVVFADHMHMDRTVKDVLDQGGKVYISPHSTEEALPRSVRCQYATDFWSVGSFPQQSGTMGQLIQADHPLFDEFPTKPWSTWQWWPMASQRAMILPKRLHPIITEMDSYAYLRPMAQLFEARCGRGASWCRPWVCRIFRNIPRPVPCSRRFSAIWIRIDSLPRTISRSINWRKLSDEEIAPWTGEGPRRRLVPGTFAGWMRELIPTSRSSHSKSETLLP